MNFILSNITNDTYIPLFTKSGNTEVMRKIKANVLNNGGSSTHSAQPDRVIIIDTTLEQNIEGKAYKTFAEAKTWIDENRVEGEEYQIELPAGRFMEQVTISNYYVVHGNNTILTAPVASTETMDVSAGIDPSGVKYIPLIENCVISGGFVGNTMSIVPVFRFRNCTIENVTSDAPGFGLAESCVIDCDSNTNGMMSLFALNSTINDITTVSINAFHCEIFGQFNSTGQTSAFFFCYIYETASIMSGVNDKVNNNFIHCHFSWSSGINEQQPSLYRARIFRNCNGRIKIVDNHSAPYVENSNIEFLIPENCNVNNITADSKSIIYCRVNGQIDNIFATYNTKINGVKFLITNNYQPKHFMYSADGGLTMHETKENDDNAIGILKDLNTVYTQSDPVNSSSYEWIPLLYN